MSSATTFCNVYNNATSDNVQKMSIGSCIDNLLPSNECFHRVELAMKDGRTWQVAKVSNEEIATLMAAVKALNKEICFDHNVNEQHFESLSPLLEREFASSGLQGSFDNIATISLQKIFAHATEVKEESQEDAAPPETQKIDAKKIDLQAEMKKKDVKNSEWKSTALRIAIISAIILAAVVVVGGLITGFVFTCIYCPIAAYIIGSVAAAIVIHGIGLGIFLYKRSHR